MGMFIGVGGGRGGGGGRETRITETSKLILK
jgi:hypothetical protein